MISIKYKLENDTTAKSVIVNNVKSNIDSDTAAIEAFGSELTTYFNGDYALVGATKIVTEETEIEIN